MSKYGGKGGELEMRNYSFKLRQFLSKDAGYTPMLEYLENMEEEPTFETVKKHIEDHGLEWNLKGLDYQMYSILVASSVPESPAAEKLMALEKREGEGGGDALRGLMAYWDFSRELLGTSEGSKGMIATRVRSPAQVMSLDDLEVRILQWEEDLRRHEAYEKNKMADSLKLSILKGMVPPSLAATVRLHKPKTYFDLRSC